MSPPRYAGPTRPSPTLRVSFNASPPTTHPTEAQLYREAARRSGAQAFDEMESLKGGGDKERLAALISVLNAGFEQGGAVSRQEKARGTLRRGAARGVRPAHPCGDRRAQGHARGSQPHAGDVPAPAGRDGGAARARDGA